MAQRLTLERIFFLMASWNEKQTKNIQIEKDCYPYQLPNFVITLATLRVREPSMNYSEFNLKRKRINFCSFIKGDKIESVEKDQKFGGKHSDVSFSFKLHATQPLHADL